MVNYTKTKIYKIVFPGGEEIIGTTTKKYLSQRKTQINYIYKKFLEKAANAKSPLTLSKFHILMNMYGYDSYDIILIDNIVATTKDEINAILYEYH